MKKILFTLLVIVLFSCGSTATAADKLEEIAIPKIESQITQTYYIPAGFRPPVNHGDMCIKWIKQMPMSVFDGRNWHFHPAQEICYLRESQRHR